MNLKFNSSRLGTLSQNHVTIYTHFGLLPRCSSKSVRASIDGNDHDFTIHFFCLVLGAVAYTGSRVLLPKHATWQDRATFIWLVRVFKSHFKFDGVCSSGFARRMME